MNKIIKAIVSITLLVSNAMAFQSEQNYTLKFGISLNSVLASANTSWSATEFSNGIEESPTLGVTIKGIYEREIYRASLDIEQAKWDKASYTEFKIAGDYLYNYKEVKYYGGLGVGTLNFSEDHTDKSSSNIAYELRGGVLLKNIPFASYKFPQNVELELGYRYKIINAKNSEVIQSSTHKVSLESAHVLSMGFNYSF